MKKLLVLVMALAFFAGSGFAEGKGEVNVKLGLDPFGSVKIDTDYGDNTEDSKVGFNIAAEYLYPVHDIVKIGAGLEYLFQREMDRSPNPEFSFMPIYATVLVNPIEQAPELYFRGNLGYNVLFDLDVDGVEDEKGGLYWGLGAGYNFDFGLVLEAVYSFYYSSFGSDGDDADVTYSKLGINVGYKFKL